MVWVKGTPLIASVEELERFLGPHDLSNLETAGYDLMLLVARASDQVRAAIKGVDPAKIANEDDYKPAVAEHVKALLVKGRFLPPPEGQAAPVDPFEWSEPLLRRVEPQLSSGDRPTSIGSAFPRVKNLDDHSFFG